MAELAAAEPMLAELAAAEPMLLRPDQAPQRYLEAVQTAVAACAAETVGQTCYICYGGGDEDEGLVRGCACRGASGFVHISCLARQAEVFVERVISLERWYSCGLCEQNYHSVVLCALGWAAWKTYLGRPEADLVRQSAMNLLGAGLSAARHHEDASTVEEAELSLARRLGEPEENILVMQGNLAGSYRRLGRLEEALRSHQDVYSGSLKLLGEEAGGTLKAANNYALSLSELQRFEEAKALLCKVMPVARRVLGDNDEITLWIRRNFARALCKDPTATLDDLREGVTTLEDTERTARRVFGVSHPLTEGNRDDLRHARAALHALETPPPPPSAPLYDEDELD